jgi:hypothetical protein
MRLAKSEWAIAPRRNAVREVPLERVTWSLIRSVPALPCARSRREKAGQGSTTFVAGWSRLVGPTVAPHKSWLFVSQTAYHSKGPKDQVVYVHVLSGLPCLIGPRPKRG